MLTLHRSSIPVRFSEDDGEWLVDSIDPNLYARCDCHDLVWHTDELATVPTPSRYFGDLLVCKLP